MKQRTKTMLSKVGKELKKIFSKNENEVWKEYGAEFISFLEDLPKLEKSLATGGFVPDRNKTPCKDGDRIIIRSSKGEKREGHIEWNPRTCTFLFVSELDNYAWYFKELKDSGLSFEKKALEKME